MLVNYAPRTNAPPSAASPVVTGPLAATTVTNSLGIFSLASLEPGEYVACAETTTPGLLDPCHWASAAPTFTVSASQTTSGVNIVMARGAVVPVHIDDPLTLLKAVTGPIDFDLQVHVVTARGIHHNASIQALSATGRDLAVTIPFGLSATIQVLSPHLVVNDSTGKPVSAAGAGITVASGSLLPTVAFAVAGTK